MSKDELPLCGFFFDIDLFGSDVDIYYKGRPKRNSWIGRTLTLLYAGIYIFFFIFRVVRMANKVDVTFYDTYAFNGQPPYMKINNEIFRSGFALLHPLTQEPYVNPSIYNVKMTYSTGVKVGAAFIFDTSNVELEPCTVNKFGSRYQDLFLKKKISGLYCAKENEHLLQGHRAYDVYSFWKIEFFPCVNSTDNDITCAPIENITRLLTRFGVNFAMQDIELTPEDYKESTKPRVKDISVAVSSSLHIDAYAYLQVVNIETDEDIFGLGTSNNIRKEKYLKYDQAQILYSNGKLDLDNPGVPLVSFTVGLSEQELTETRTYPKLIAVIGDVGGFMEVIFSGFSVLAAILTETLYQKSLVNYLFSFDLDKKVVLVKQKEINPLKINKSNKIYNLDKYHKNTLINDKHKEKEKEQKIKDINQSAKPIKGISHQKTKELKPNVILFSKKTPNYSFLFDSSVKHTIKIKNNDESKKEDYSSRILNNNINNSLKKKEVEINIMDLDKTEKTENESESERNIITKIELNQFKPKFCYRQKREHFEKILLEEGMKIVLKKLDIQNLFRKIYKDNLEINEECEYIEMSNNCKKELRNVLDGQVRTLVI